MDDSPTFDFALGAGARGRRLGAGQATAVPRGGLEWFYKEGLRQAPRAGAEELGAGAVRERGAGASTTWPARRHPAGPAPRPTCR